MEAQVWQVKFGRCAEHRELEKDIAELKKMQVERRLVIRRFELRILLCRHRYWYPNCNGACQKTNRKRKKQLKEAGA